MGWVIVDIDWGNTTRNLLANAKAPKAILRQTAQILMSGSRLAFEEEGRNPQGKWPKRSVPNIAGIFADFAAGRPGPLDRRFETGQTLVDTGRLRNSVADPNDAEIDLSTNEVTIQSRLPYAKDQQEGAEDKLVGVITEEFQTWLRAFIMRDVGSIRADFGGDAAGVAMESFDKNLGWLLNPNMVGEEVRIDIPARPFLEITPQDVADIKEMVGVLIDQSPDTVV